MKTPAMTEAAPVKAKTARTNDSARLMLYFVSHPKLPHSVTVSPMERTALLVTVKRLLQNYEYREVQGAIDKFFDQGVGHLISPTKVFCAKKVQQRLLTAGTRLHNDVDRFIANGFERTEGMMLPWPEADDIHVRRRILRDPSSKDEVVNAYL